MVVAFEAEVIALVEPAPTTLPAVSAIRRQSDLYRFGAVAMATGAAVSPLSIYLPQYYGGYVGMSLGQVGLAFLIVRLFDISFDPLMGMLLDRTRTRFGQARPWLVVGIGLMTLASPWLFMAPKGVGVLYLVVGLLMIYAGGSMAGLAQSAWSARLVRDYTERNRLWGWIQIVAYISSFVLIASPLLLAGHRGGKNGDDMHLMGWILTIGVPVVAFLTLVGIPEPPVPGPANEYAQRVKLADYLELMRMPNVRVVIIADVVLAVATGTTAILFLFFWRDARGYTPAASTILILCYMVAGFIGTPLWVRIARKIGKRGALIASIICYAILIPGMAVAPRNHLLLLAAGQFLLGLSFAAGAFLLRSMAADVADEVRLRLRKDRTGQLFGLFGSTAKVGTAVTALYALGLLQMSGFDAKLGVANSARALLALNLLYLVAPGLLMLVAAGILTLYKLNRAEHQRVLDELADRDQANAAEASV